MKFTNLILSTITIFGLYSCSSDDTIPNEEEVITTVIYELAPVEGGENVTFTFEDLDLTGSNPPVITNGVLQENTTYTGALMLQNKANGEVEDVNLEIIEEDEDHQLFYIETSENLTINYTDSDENGNPLGIETTLTTGDAEENIDLTIVLRHLPNKLTSTAKEGDITGVGGETEADVTFSINVQ